MTLKQYQVTKKLQVTIPKKLAEKAGIEPGDCNGGIRLRPEKDSASDK
ncbi:MAG: AbrB/MazE/SpoVT family DNA-binding domain-containing protein [Thaumarchaeota archaeon]|nr:MAG: AbrB/MazE/SpoVT family DNA-binding domain-containing protein [Nitrososphaerota archaeon]